MTQLALPIHGKPNVPAAVTKIEIGNTTLVGMRGGPCHLQQEIHTIPTLLQAILKIESPTADLRNTGLSLSHGPPDITEGPLLPPNPDHDETSLLCRGQRAVIIETTMTTTVHHLLGELVLMSGPSTTLIDPRAAVRMSTALPVPKKPPQAGESRYQQAQRTRETHGGRTPCYKLVLAMPSRPAHRLRSETRMSKARGWGRKVQRLLQQL